MAFSNVVAFSRELYIASTSLCYKSLYSINDAHCLVPSFPFLSFAVFGLVLVSFVLVTEVYLILYLVSCFVALVSFHVS